MKFDENHLELSIMELFENQGYAHITGSEIHHEKTEVLLIDVLRNYLLFRYGSQNITENEITSAVNRIKNISSDLYDENKKVLDLLCNGFTLRRDDPTQKQEVDFIEEIDGKFSAFEFKYNQKKANAKCPLTFSNNYPEIPFSVISKENYLDFITEESIDC